MLRALIRQLCGARSDFPQWFKDLGSTFRDKNALPGLKGLEATLWKTTDGFDEVYLVIDVLDECTTVEKKRETLLNSIVSLQKVCPSNVHCLVTSRKEPGIEANLARSSEGIVRRN